MILRRLRAYLARPMLDEAQVACEVFRQELIRRLRDGLALSLMEYQQQVYAAGEMAGRKAVCDQLEQMLAERRDVNVIEDDVARLRRLN